MKIDELIECLRMESEAAYNAENLILRDTLDEAAETIRVLDAVPAADVVEVVRCKNCKYGVPTKNGFLNDSIACENEDSPCGYSSWLCQPDWFCADGERREVQDGAET